MRLPVLVVWLVEYICGTIRLPEAVAVPVTFSNVHVFWGRLETRVDPSLMFEL